MDIYIYMLLMLTAEPRPVIGPQAVSAQPMSGRDADEMRRPRRRHQMSPGLEDCGDFRLCTSHFALRTPSWPPSCQTPVSRHDSFRGSGWRVARREPLADEQWPNYAVYFCP